MYAYIDLPLSNGERDFSHNYLLPDGGSGFIPNFAAANRHDGAAMFNHFMLYSSFLFSSMNIYKYYSCVVIFFFLSVTAVQGQVNGQRLSDWVNPLIGTTGMGHTFPGACAPFGIVQLSPDTDTIPHNVNGKYQPHAYAYCAGYRYEDPTIVGFSHTHLSGTGHSDLGDVLIQPQMGKLRLHPGTADRPDEGYRSRFSHETEKASAGYYEVLLRDDSIRAQLTATQRVGIHRYTYPKGRESRFILDLGHGIYNYDGKTLWASLRVENDTLLTGYRITNGWARCNYTYFAISLSKPLKSYGYRDRKEANYKGFWRKFDLQHNFPEMAGRDVVAYFNFDNVASRQLTLKVALSAVSTEGAIRNLQHEAAGKSFEALCEATKQQWDKELASVECEATPDQKSMLYTSLYHTMINPSVYMDVDRQYRGLDGNIHRAEGFENYTIFSLWDTYRALHPLLMLLKPERNTDMVKSMLAHYGQSVHHLLPVWSLMGNEGWCMTGYHAVSVLSDALAKGAKVDGDAAIKAMLSTARSERMPGLNDYRMLGYAPYDHDATAASNTLEYAYDDWTIYAAALVAGKKDVADEFARRALSYRNVYDPNTGFACPRYSDGKFKEPMNPYQTYNEGFIEGNSWNFSFHVPHDVMGLMAKMGGEPKFRQRLNELFSMDLPPEYYADNEDITADCLVGGYVHGNEPSHHVPYLFAWTREPWKTQQWVRTIMNRMYRNDIRGLGGNDDCGQMSAWYIFSAMGFYPVCPGSDQYVLGAPYLPYLRVTLPNGNAITIRANGVSDQRRYVKSLRVNGQPYDKLYISHAMLTNGCTLDFEMSDKPNRKRGLKSDDKPYSMTTGADLPQTAWADHLRELRFTEESPDSKGAAIYHSIVKNPEQYIRKVAEEVMQTLYFSPSDSIPMVQTLDYVLKSYNGVSAKDGGNGKVSIWYSTNHVEKSFVGNDTAKVDFETRGVLLHELTHAFQLEPQGIGNYGNSPVFWQLIEGMADAVRVMNGGFHGEADRPKGGSYTQGYRHTGYFIAWVTEHIDRHFLRKLNRSCLEVVPWSWNGAVRFALGNSYDIDSLWQEYQRAVGDLK